MESFKKDDIILLDITTAITLVSDCCTETESLLKYGEKLKTIGGNVYEQIKNENENPVYPKLLELFKNKQLCMVTSAYNKFINMIERMGSETEVKNLIKLKSKLNIITPEPNNFFKNLGEDAKLMNKKKWSIENIDTFGTADTKGWTVFTGNLGIALFLQERKDILNLKCQPHRSRSFVGKRKYLKINAL